ncbi:MAG: prepilin-type N-terminal cleavage/methylation domain-containing protein [Magnetococcales bacterium]|nr:prepilin-type N-terminal cleavage/methylation domain-containing protein [Magnetococcales bacterium]
MQKHNKQWGSTSDSGFTLIEVATVMVIVGLILGTGVMMSGSLISGAHSKDVSKLAADLIIASSNFKERYGYLPGDLPDAANDISGIAAADACNYDRTTDTVAGNGLIENNTATGGKSSEMACAPVHLTNAGFIKGDGSTIRTDFGSVFLMDRATAEALGTNALVAIDDSIRNVIVFYNLPRNVVLALDEMFDDGVISSTTGKAIASDSSVDTAIVPFFAIPL